MEIFKLIATYIFARTLIRPNISLSSTKVGPWYLVPFELFSVVLLLRVLIVRSFVLLFNDAMLAWKLENETVIRINRLMAIGN